MIKLKRMRWVGHVACMVTIPAYRVLVGKLEGKRKLGRPRHKWEDTIQIDIGEIGWGGVDWINLAQGRDQWRAFVNMAMNLWVP
jgi:hypothetical protein